MTDETRTLLVDELANELRTYRHSKMASGALAEHILAIPRIHDALERPTNTPMSGGDVVTAAAQHWWMIERHDCAIHPFVSPMYFFWQHKPGSKYFPRGQHDWTPDWQKGARFSTKEAAEEHTNSDPLLRVVDHAMIETNTPMSGGDALADPISKLRAIADAADPLSLVQVEAGNLRALVAEHRQLEALATLTTSGDEVERGRVSFTVTHNEAGELSRIADALEEVAQAIPLRLLRRRTVRDVAGPWTCVIDFRAEQPVAAISITGGDSRG
jgi:HAMP domain-containing protein